MLDWMLENIPLSVNTMVNEWK